MKKLTQWAVVLWMSSTAGLMAEDYALTERYTLFYDIKAAQQQQTLVIRIQELMNDNALNRESFAEAKAIFDRQLTGLMKGDGVLHLAGTNIPSIRTKLDHVQTLWQETQEVVLHALEERKYRQEAQQSLNKLLNSVNISVLAYDQSYERYKQRSKLSAIVNRHVNYGKTDRLAFNTIQ